MSSETRRSAEVGGWEQLSEAEAFLGLPQATRSPQRWHQPPQQGLGGAGDFPGPSHWHCLGREGGRLLKWSCPIHVWIPESLAVVGRQVVPRTPWKWGAGWGMRPPSEPTFNRADPSARHSAEAVQ